MRTQWSVQRRSWLILVVALQLEIGSSGMLRRASVWLNDGTSLTLGGWDCMGSNPTPPPIVASVHAQWLELDGNRDDIVRCVRRKKVSFTRNALSDRSLEMRRPTWITTQRCSNTQCTPCDKESSNKETDGCLVWAPCGGRDQSKCMRPQSSDGYALKTGADSNMKTSSITLTLKCSKTEAVLFSMSYGSLGNSKVSIHFNGDEKFSSRQSNANYEGTLAGVDGENELVFSVDRLDPTAAAQVQDVKLGIKNVRPDFTECEDKKACLDPSALGKDWATTQAKDLRSFLHLQHLCLMDKSRLEGDVEYSSYAGVCSKWAECLQKSDRLESIAAIIEASAGSLAPQLSLLQIPAAPTEAAACEDNDMGLLVESGRSDASCATDKRLCADEANGAIIHKYCRKTCGECKISIETKCRNPHLIDPENWDCACHEQMVKKCTVPDLKSMKFAACGRLWY